MCELPEMYPIAKHVLLICYALADGARSSQAGNWQHKENGDVRDLRSLGGSLCGGSGPAPKAEAQAALQGARDGDERGRKTAGTRGFQIQGAIQGKKTNLLFYI